MSLAALSSLISGAAPEPGTDSSLSRFRAPYFSGESMLSDAEKMVMTVPTWQEALALVVRQAVQVDWLYRYGFSKRYAVMNMSDRWDGTDRWAACSADKSAPEGTYSVLVPHEVHAAAGHRDPFGDLIEALRKEQA